MGRPAGGHKQEQFTIRHTDSHFQQMQQRGKLNNLRDIDNHAERKMESAIYLRYGVFLYISKY